MEYRMVHYTHDLSQEELEGLQCDVEGCEKQSTHCVSYDTRYDKGRAKYVGGLVCENHIEQFAQELWDEFGPTDGKSTEITASKL
jgi:hypothetical protein